MNGIARGRVLPDPARAWAAAESASPLALETGAEHEAPPRAPKRSPRPWVWGACAAAATSVLVTGIATMIPIVRGDAPVAMLHATGEWGPSTFGGPDARAMPYGGFREFEVSLEELTALRCVTVSVPDGGSVWQGCTPATGGELPMVADVPLRAGLHSQGDYQVGTDELIDGMYRFVLSGDVVRVYAAGNVG